MGIRNARTLVRFRETVGTAERLGTVVTVVRERFDTVTTVLTRYHYAELSEERHKDGGGGIVMYINICICDPHGRHGLKRARRDPRERTE